jgi:vacuolar-type H+-ATPase subunit H
MTAFSGASATGALDAVRRLEMALGERTGAPDASAAGLGAARQQAERMLAEARTAGSDAGRRRRAELLAEAETHASAIRAAGRADAKELHERVSARRAELIGELIGMLLPDEAPGTCSSR